MDQLKKFICISFWESHFELFTSLIVNIGSGQQDSNLENALPLWRPIDFAWSENKQIILLRSLDCYY